PISPTGANIINFRVSNCFIRGTTFGFLKIENFVLENSRIEDLQIFSQNLFNIRIRNCHFNQSNFWIEDTSDVEVTDSIFEGNSRTPLLAYVRESVVELPSNIESVTSTSEVSSIQKLDWLK